MQIEKRPKHVQGPVIAEIISLQIRSGPTAGNASLAHRVILAPMSSLPLEFCVNDNGPGVPEDLMPHLFDPFVTTKPSRSGLGLALVARSSAIMEASSSASRKPSIRFFAC
jgi:nitrogen-specific signal transduction histidine kinase